MESRITFGELDIKLHKIFKEIFDQFLQKEGLSIENIAAIGIQPINNKVFICYKEQNIQDWIGNYLSNDNTLKVIHLN